MSWISYPASVHHDDHRPNGLRAWPLRSRAAVVVLGGIAGMIAAWAALGLVVDRVLGDTAIGRADERLPQWFEDRRTDTWNSVSYWGSMLADTYVKIGLIVVVGAVAMIVWHRWHDALLLAGSVIIEATVFLFASLVVDRPRPDVEQLDPVPPTGSFPSGHSAAATTFYLALCVVVLWHTRQRWLRATFVALAVLAPLVVGVSRIQRGMHHPIDVVAGAALGICSVLLMRFVLAIGTARLRELHDQGAIDAPPQTRRLDQSRPMEEEQ